MVITTQRICAFFLKPVVQISAIGLLFAFIVGTGFLKINKREFIDAQPSVLQISAPNTVKVGLNIQNFLGFEIVQNQFIIDGNIWFIFDPRVISQESVAQFTFNKGEIIERSEPFVQKMSDGSVMLRYDIKVKFSANLVYKYFPLDVHRLYIVLNNKHLDAHSVEFYMHENNFVVSNTLYIPGWHVEERHLKNGYASWAMSNDESELFKYPRIVLALDLVPSTMRDYIFIMLPLLIILLLSLGAFALNLKTHFGSMLSITTTGIGALLTYRYVIEGIAPQVSYYLLSDHIFSLFLLFLFFLFFIEVFYKEKIDPYRGAAVTIIYMLLGVCWTYLLFVW